MPRSRPILVGSIALMGFAAAERGPSPDFLANVSLLEFSSHSPIALARPSTR
jgi:hypothetical protein